MAITLNGTDQYIKIEDFTADTHYDVHITMAAGNLPNGFNDGSDNTVVATNGYLDTGEAVESKADGFIWGIPGTLQIDSSPIWTNAPKPTVATVDSYLSDTAVIKVTDIETTTTGMDGGKYFIFVGGKKDSNIAGTEINHMEMNIAQIDVYLALDDSLVCSFDLTTPAASYSNNGKTLTVVNYVAGDTSAPVFSSGPTVTATSGSGHTLSQTMDEDCTLYAIRIASADTAPTSAQVKAGVDYAGATVLEYKDNVAALSGVSKDIVFSTGSVSTEYKYYVVAEDASANLSATPATVTATTSAGSIAITGGTLTAGSAFAGTYSGIASLATPITLTDSGGNTLNVAIVDGGSGNFTGTMPALPSSGSSSSLIFGNVTITGNA
jgi:hypothetical protein